jgi:hypothetical protein
MTVKFCDDMEPERTLNVSCRVLHGVFKLEEEISIFSGDDDDDDDGGGGDGDTKFSLQ